MAINDKLQTISSSIDDIRTTLKEFNHSLGQGTVSTLGDDVRSLDNNSALITYKDSEGNYKTMSLHMPGNTCPVFYNTDLVPGDIINVILPENISIIPGNAFRDCTELEYINLAVTSIGRYALAGCTGLTSLTIPSSVTSIGDYAFSDCNGLTGALTIPSSVTSIGASAFYGCSGLTNLDLGKADVVPSVYTSSGNGNGILKIGGNLNATTRVAYYFKHFLIDGDISGTRQLINNDDTRIESVRIGGDWGSTGGLVYYNTHSYLRFFELNGRVTSNFLFGNYTALSFSIHFGYNGIAVALSNFSETSAQTTSHMSKISKIYVGDGSSAAHDDAILAQYLADPDWAAYSSKLDTWYNYVQSGGEYATLPTIPDE